MLKSIFTRSIGKQGRLRAALVATIGFAIAGIALPAHAQELETFDPDDAFEVSEPREVQDAAAQVTSSVAGDVVGTNSVVDDSAIGADIADPLFQTAPDLDPVTGRPSPTQAAPVEPAFVDEFAGYDAAPLENEQGYANVGEAPVGEAVPQWSEPQQAEAGAAVANQSDTYGQDDLIGAAEGVFGKGAQGLAGMIEDLLKKQGQPNGYIVGREAGGAFIFGARYGSGTLYHKIEGERKVYWTGPSLGLDAGANAGNTFVLVYNLFDSEDIFKRYPAGEGQAYLVGGLHASYMRRGDVVLIPIRMGAGLRLGVNAGYMRFSKKHRWLPF